MRSIIYRTCSLNCDLLRELAERLNIYTSTFKIVPHYYQINNQATYIIILTVRNKGRCLRITTQQIGSSHCFLCVEYLQSQFFIAYKHFLLALKQEVRNDDQNSFGLKKQTRIKYKH